MWNFPCFWIFKGYWHLDMNIWWWRSWELSSSLCQRVVQVFFPGCLCFPSKNTPSMIRMISLGRVELGKPLSSSTAYFIAYLEDFFESRVSSNKNPEFPKIHQKSAYGKTSAAFHGRFPGRGRRSSRRCPLGETSSTTTEVDVFFPPKSWQWFLETGKQ